MLMTMAVMVRGGELAGRGGQQCCNSHDYYRPAGRGKQHHCLLQPPLPCLKPLLSG